MDTTNQSEDIKPCDSDLMESILMFDEPISDILAHNKLWISHARTRSNFFPQEGRHISNQHTEAATSLKMWMLSKNLVVIVKRKDDIFPCKILTRNPENLFVARFLESGKEKHIQVEYSDIIMTRSELEKALPLCQHLIPARNWDDFYIIRDFEKATPYFEQGLSALVKPGQQFELQLEDAPDFYVMATVVKNYRGFLLVEYQNFKRWIHMLSPYCHEIGWGKNEKQEYLKRGPYNRHMNVDLVAGLVKQSTNQKLGAVPEIVFRNNCPVPHRIPEYSACVYLDLDQKRFYFAHKVTTKTCRNNRHFFNISIGKNLVTSKQNNRPYEFHVYHPRILPYSVAKRMEVQIILPPDVKLLPDESNLDGYLRTYCNPCDKHKTSDRVQPSPKIAKKKNGPLLLDDTPDAMFRSRPLLGDNIGAHKEWTNFMNHIPDYKRKDLLKSMDTLKFCEIFRPTPTGALQLTAAEVTGQQECMLRLKVSGEDEPVYIHNADPHLYHLGACLDMELAINFHGEFFDEKPLKKNKNANNGFSSF
ncbi:Sop-2-related protein 3 [Caenorhabditis elegans]|uniref:Sop-2-related protein 3 n=1 Tax=Caenorhabditis elegans TaxID=6239 RepID=SOR3_CAEEL|nr:Sop-2-related protein 3 [Caenorhabditis elegans]Q11193.3 RecName: Full=Sop-2-related protein 3 [Caenorhabditis elegans]CCD62907.1 Sop-2-related protein 3 [Caenorhabditis elegans]|eukprot:NP_508090.2 Sop-2-related protein 3 [Caenorhabditis elegans]